MLTRFVAGREKVLVGLLAVLQSYIAAVEWLIDPEKAAIIGLIGVAQFWLCGDSPRPELHDPANDTLNPSKEN